MNSKEQACGGSITKEVSPFEMRRLLLVFESFVQVFLYSFFSVGRLMLQFQYQEIGHKTTKKDRMQVLLYRMYEFLFFAIGFVLHMVPSFWSLLNGFQKNTYTRTYVSNCQRQSRHRA